EHVDADLEPGRAVDDLVAAVCRREPGVGARDVERLGRPQGAWFAHRHSGSFSYFAAASEERSASTEMLSNWLGGSRIAPERSARPPRFTGKAVASPAAKTSSRPTTQPLPSVRMKPFESLGMPLIRGPLRRGRATT